MTNKDLFTNHTLKAPRVPAALCKLGSERSRKQPSGDSVTFRVIKLKTEYADVYSKLDGFASTWFTEEKIWVPIDSLIEGQLEILKV